MDDAPYDPKSIANLFLEIAENFHEPITPMKMQKLVYYAHGWYAGHTGRPLITDGVEAWQYGPVIPALYSDFARYGARPITRKASSWSSFDVEEYEPVPENKAIRIFINKIWISYGKYSGIYLSELTHVKNGPWDKVRRESGTNQKVPIPFEVLRDYFQELVARVKQDKVSL